MKLEGSVINFLGDSITEGIGASCEETCFVRVLEREYGLKKANNYGIGGSRIARQVVITDAPYDRDFCMRCTEMDPSADAVVVFGGTNDFGHGEAPMGNPGDRDPSTFWGACHYLMSSLLDQFSGKPILIVTPLHRAAENNPGGDGTGRKLNCHALLREYREVLMEVAGQYGLPVLDLFTTSGIQPLHEKNRALLAPDGLHPSDLGHAIIARRIGEYLKLL